MNQEQFAAACAEAIKPYHDAQLDGPLLLGTRTNAAPSVLHPDTMMVYTEYAAVLGAWPKAEAHPYGGLNDHGPIYYESAAEAIVPLVKAARELWEARMNSEPEGDDFIRAGGDVICPDCNQPYKNHPYSHAEGDLFHGNPFLNVLCNGTKVKL